MPSDILNVQKQLVFYGAYHSNKVNIRIHQVFVPILIWTFQIMLSTLPTPSFFPQYRHDFNSVLSFEVNWATIQCALYLTYYFSLLPSATLLYIPQALLSVLSAVAVSRNPDNVKLALAVNVTSWIAQFYGHGVHERRAPALLDNLLGALVLAPFFVHLELLFEIGYYPTLYKQVTNGVGKEILKFRQEAAAKSRKSS